jgi:hypothetical protein
VWWERTRTGHPRLDRWLQPAVDVWAELPRVELVDRSLAVGAQALLALIPLLMVLGVARCWAGSGRPPSSAGRPGALHEPSHLHHLQAQGLQPVEEAVQLGLVHEPGVER